ncbi:MAG: hypothetical protein ACRD8O_09400 [Bryobacteraceae bacterium]
MPETIRVKLSSETAESISITPVVVREMPTRELVEHMLGITGKDEARVAGLLRRGTLVSGASRFRWTGWEAAPESVRAMLATFPDAEPGRLFAAERCVRAVLRDGMGRRLELPREVAAKRPLLRRTSFWDVLMRVAAESSPRYVEYSYRERADCFALGFSAGNLARLREGARLITYTTLRFQIRTAGVESGELFVVR